MTGKDVFSVDGTLLPDENDELFTPLRAILNELLATPGKGLRGRTVNPQCRQSPTGDGQY